MDNLCKDHIITNIVELTECTKDESVWYTHLLKHKLLSQSTWEKIRHTEHCTQSRIREMYMECTKTADYKSLIQSLKYCGNNQAAIILEDFYSASSSSARHIKPIDLFWLNMRNGTKHFKGREDELQTIRNYYLEASATKSLIFVGITGLGGVGKSELARNYAKEFHENVKGHCIWINAETEQTFSNSFQKLAKKMGVSLLDECKKEKTLESLTNEVYEQFSTNYLVVFDNLNNYDEDFFECFVQYADGLAPSKLKPFVLLTSRYQLIEQTLGERAKQVNLTVLSDSSSLSFFKEALDIPNEHEDIIADLTKIYRLLDKLPLAMQQAAAYINQEKRKSDVLTEVKAYITSFEKETKQLLDFPLPKIVNLDSFSKTTYITWKITLDKLEISLAVGTMAKFALNIVSFFNSENIPLNFLQKLMDLFCQVENNEMRRKKKVDIFMVLSDYSMCEMFKKENEISVHRLVQMVTQINLKEEGRWPEMLNILLQITNDVYEVDITFRRISHVISLLNHTKNNTHLISNKQGYTYFLGRISTDYLAGGQFREGYKFNLFAVEQVKILFGNDSKETVRSQYLLAVAILYAGDLQGANILIQDVYKNQLKLLDNNSEPKMDIVDDISHTKFIIAEIYKQQGKYAESMHILLEAENFQKQKLGKNQFLPVLLKSHIAELHKLRGNNEEALKLYLEAFEIEKCFRGTSHPSTLCIKHNMALVYQNQGKYDEALKNCLEVFEVQKSVLGMEHPSTLGSKHNIAQLYQDQGKYEVALKMNWEVFEVQTRLLGAEHPCTLTTKGNIALIYYYQGKSDKSLELNLEIMEVRKRLLSMEHPSTLDIISNIATIYKDQGKYDEALKMYSEVVVVRQRLHGLKDPRTLTTKNNLAVVFKSQGKYEQALKICLEVCGVQTLLLGVQHPDTSCTRINIAAIKQCLGKFDEALQIFLEVLEAQKALLGMEHPDTLCAQNNVATSYFKQGKFDDALKINLEVVEVGKRALGMEHPITLNTKHKIATVYLNQGKYDEALPIYLEVLEVQTRLLGIKHPDTSCTRSNIATIYQNQKKYGEALKIFLEVFEAQRTFLGMEHTATLCAQNNVANSYLKQKKYDDALKINLEVVEVGKRLLGMEHPIILKAKHEIALVYQNQGKYDEALPIYLEVLEGQTRLFGMDHPDTLCVYRNISLLYISQRKYDKALKIYLDIFPVQRRMFGTEHPNTLRMERNIVRLYPYRGNND